MQKKEGQRKRETTKILHVFVMQTGHLFHTEAMRKADAKNKKNSASNRTLLYQVGIFE